MGDTHWRSNIRQQGDESLVIEVNTGSFATVIVGTNHTTTFATNAVTATSLVANTYFSLNASPGFRHYALVASANLVATVSATNQKMLRVNDYSAPATPVSYYIKVKKKST